MSDESRSQVPASALDPAEPTGQPEPASTRGRQIRLYRGFIPQYLDGDTWRMVPELYHRILDACANCQAFGDNPALSINQEFGHDAIESKV
jgi:hypothetical protein